MPSPISPRNLRLARWQPRHRTPRLRGYVPAQGVNPTQTSCVDLSQPLSIALLSGHRASISHRSFAHFSDLLTRGCIFEGITPAA